MVSKPDHLKDELYAVMSSLVFVSSTTFTVIQL